VRVGPRFLIPGLWILMVVCGGWMLLGVLGDGVCVVRADSGDGWFFFRQWQWLFFVWSLYIPSFHNISFAIG
jgi:hypothetical protein